METKRIKKKAALTTELNLNPQGKDRTILVELLNAVCLILAKANLVAHFKLSNNPSIKCPESISASNPAMFAVLGNLLLRTT
jgi:hypothetical protein